ncbi:MAG: hypothetical protein U1D67_01270, partial [Dehalococcoidia bacterium]|nr:hypothetical protein [Dehalococcoidia bacterium]
NASGYLPVALKSAKILPGFFYGAGKFCLSLASFSPVLKCSPMVGRVAGITASRNIAGNIMGVLDTG